MKRHLLASTMILAASVGAASAEVTLSGDARMGIISDFGGGDTGFTSRARVSFTLSGESDGGLAFGASFRADNAGDAASGTAGSVFMSTGGFKVSMGDVDGAAQAAVGHVDGVGLTGLGDLNEINYIGAGGANGNIMNFGYFNEFPFRQDLEVTGDPTLLMEYSTGSLTMYASATQPSHTYDYGLVIDASAIALGVAYSAGAYKLSAGYEAYEQSGTPDAGSAKNLVLGADATFGAVTMKARYSTGSSEYDGTPGNFQDHTQVAVSATYVVDALALTAFASSITFDNVSNTFSDAERDAYGLGASYDLGGGAKVVGGYVNNTSVDDSAFDLGLSFAF